MAESELSVRVPPWYSRPTEIPAAWAIPAMRRASATAALNSASLLSALAFGGVHSASYARRPGALARLVTETPSLARRLPAGFEHRVEYAARVKLAPAEYDFAGLAGATAPAQREALRAEIVADVPAVTGLLAWEQTLGFEIASLALVCALLTRAACRLRGHFHERHYRPALDCSRSERGSPRCGSST